MQQASAARCGLKFPSRSNRVGPIVPILSSIVQIGQGVPGARDVARCRNDIRGRVACAEFVAPPIIERMSSPEKHLSLKSLKADRDAVMIRWNDGASHRIAWKTLRDRCPCATCRQQRTEPPAVAPLFNIIKPEETVPVRATAMTPVGNYAYQIDFSDGHKTGIFSLELLREIGETSHAS